MSILQNKLVSLFENIFKMVKNLRVIHGTKLPSCAKIEEHTLDSSNKGLQRAAMKR